jgi:hypothetical protein
MWFNYAPKKKLFAIIAELVLPELLPPGLRYILLRELLV